MLFVFPLQFARVGGVFFPRSGKNFKFFGKKCTFFEKKSLFCVVYNKNVISLQRNSKRKESNMNWNEVEKYARKKGWEFERHGAKHDIYRHPNKPYKIQIERHWSTEVRDGLLKTLLKRIGE